ncbi:hypothetical protein SOHN41_00344 [Shewanella sp. HN-41]|nr:hypothetical protein SOHN41_00344 [Shewanella sp. HN-41]
MVGDMNQTLLEESSEELRAILQAAADVIVIIDYRGTVLHVNSALQSLFDYKPQELIGRNISLLMPEPYAKEHDGYIDRYLRTNEARVIGINRELVARRKGGSLFPINLLVRRVEGFPRFVGIIRDMSEQVLLEREALQSCEIERNRISRELHDDLGQNLTGQAMLARGLANQLEKDGHALWQPLLSLSEELQQNVRNIRNVINELATVELEEQGLEVALRRFIDKCNGYGEAQVRMVFSGKWAVGDYGVEVQLYRIAREAVYNALKHAEASLIELRLEQTAEHICLDIQDDGKGLSPTLKIRDGRLIKDGQGLRNIYFRAHVIGARLSIESSANKGTHIQCLYARSKHSHNTGQWYEQDIVDR